MIVVCSNYFIAIYIQKQIICELKKKRKRKPMTKDNRIITLLYSTFVEFLLFLIMPNFVETVLSMRTSVAICLVVFLAVNALEEIRARLAFLYSKL